MSSTKKETLTIQISKVSYDGEFATWELDVTDHNGNNIGGGTAPTFVGAYDMAYDILRSDVDANNVPTLSFIFEGEDEDPEDA